MKTIADIKAEFEKIDLRAKEEHEALSMEAFEVYEKMDEVNKILTDLECCVNGEYSTDRYGELIYSVEVPAHLADLPYINDYLTRDYGFLMDDLRLAQHCGPFIGINWNSTSREFFVYDSDTHKEIVSKADLIEEGHPTIKEETYVAAKLEAYQKDKGEFGDIIEVGYYGDYLRHFDTWEYLKETCDSLEDNEAINKIIEEYETYRDNQGE